MVEVTNDDSFPRLLVVDDNPQLLHTLALGFRAQDFKVVTASHGADALVQFHAHHGEFMAVLTDNEMPGMCGSVLITHLRALDYQGQILVMSGNWTPAYHREYQTRRDGLSPKAFRNQHGGHHADAGE